MLKTSCGSLMLPHRCMLIPALCPTMTHVPPVLNLPLSQLWSLLLWGLETYAPSQLLCWLIKWVSYHVRSFHCKTVEGSPSLPTAPSSQRERVVIRQKYSLRGKKKHETLSMALKESKVSYHIHRPLSGIKFDHQDTQSRSKNSPAWSNPSKRLKSECWKPSRHLISIRVSESHGKFYHYGIAV